MGHGYSLRIRDLNRAADVNSAGVMLGRVCIDKDVSVVAVSKALGVSRATVYNWFCGATVPQGQRTNEILAYIKNI